MPNGEIVDTRQGQVRGRRHARGPLIFQGLPFAAPPLGALRLRPPIQPTAWAGVRDATTPGPIAPQERMQGSTAAMAEDCLYLNVTTPAADNARRPVLVYVHAGAFVAGAGSAEAYDGVHLAADQDLVVVSLNYRLGVLGFPPFNLFEAGAPQNLGLLDQVAALEWVRDNIEGFGGDPDCVTVCGYSAGGWSTVALMAMPQARGLFHRAAPQSGAFMYAQSPAAQEVHAETFFAGLELPPERRCEMLDMPVERLLQAQARTLTLWQEQIAADQVVELDFPFTPLRDEVVLREHPIDSLRKGACADLPVLVGTTSNELGAAPFRMALPWARQIHTRASIEAAIGRLSSPARAEAIWRGYAARFADADEAALVGRIRGDWMYRMPAIRIAEARAATPHGAWMYCFDVAGGSDSVGDVATHATDVTFWFGSMAVSPYQAFFFGRPPLEAEEDLSRRMQADLAQFARTGRCAWPAYGPVGRETMVYGFQTQLVADLAGAERLLWDGVV